MTLPKTALAARTRGAAHWLAQHGIGEGSRVAVDSGDVLPWLSGADLLGAATLVVEPRWSARERRAVLADAAPDLVVTGRAPGDGPARRVAGTGETLFYLPTTSGSSGSPKVLARSRDSWTRSFEALGKLPGPVLIAGPLSSSLFLFGALHALWCGRELRLANRWDADAALRAGTVHVVPAMLPALLDAAEKHAAEKRVAGKQQAGPSTIVCGGAHLDERVRARLRTVLPDTELVEYYGSAEHSLIAIRRGDEGLRPVPGVELDFRDTVLWVRSPLACAGRLRAGRLEPAAEWSTVGDHVGRTPDGALVVHGRAGAMVSSGGRLVPAEEVESVLRGVPGVAEAVVTGTPHERFGELVTAVVEATPGHSPTLRALRAGAREGLEPGKRPRRWVLTTGLPRTAAGKPARAETAKQLADGTLPTRSWT